ncbi:MAG: RIP metalloprotease RseP [Bacteroidales bacterium]|nr:RIP metalloprotease RseP [Bacteroidales bacterium]
MGALTMTVQLLLALSLLVVIHEFGHYLAAKAFGVRVKKFYLFFDFPMFFTEPTFALFRAKKVNGKWIFSWFSRKAPKEYEEDETSTEWGIGYFPLGGYCAIDGMVDETTSSDQLPAEPKPWEFRTKPAWQRLIIMIGGVTMNVIAAVLILGFSHLAFTKAYLPVENVTEGIYPSEYGRFLGFETGDKIVAINGNDVERYEDVFSAKLLFANSITVDRNGYRKEIEIPDTLYSYMKSGGTLFELSNHEVFIDSVVSGMSADKAGIKANSRLLKIDNVEVQSFGQMRDMLNHNKGRQLDFVLSANGSEYTAPVEIDSTGKIGVFVKQPQYETRKYTLASAMKYGWRDAMETLYANIKGFGLIFSGKESARESLQGPIGIAKVYGPIWDWARFWKLTGIISIILAFMNILPIPALDGGHVMLLAIEAVTRRKLPNKALDIIQRIGLIILLLLMVFIIFNDILNLF